MRRYTLILVFMMILVAVPGAVGVAAADDLPRTFAGCVLDGGDVRRVDGEVTCRAIQSSDFRIYGTATTECGEEVDLEIWGETRTGVVTYFLAPGRTMQLPETGMHDAWPPATAIACLDD